MRRLLLVVTLAACTHSRASGPAWPEPPKTDDDHADGGESIAPHEHSAVASVIEKSDDADDKPVADDKPAAAAPAAAEDKPAAAPAATPSAPDDVIMSDEIIIEIDD